MGTRDVEPHPTQVCKSKSVKDQRNTSPLNSARKPPKTAGNDEERDEQYGDDRTPPKQQTIRGDDEDGIPSTKNKDEERTPPQGADDDRIPSDKNNGDDRIPPKKRETKQIDEDRIPSTKNNGEHRIPPNNKKTKGNQTSS